MTSSDDSRTVIGFLRGRLKQRTKFPEASDMGPDGKFASEACGFLRFYFV